MDKRLKVALISIGANGALVAIKLFGAGLSNSVALKADAIHSLSDVFVSTLVLLGLLFSKEYPRWLKTVENSVALLISSLIMGAAVALFVKSLQYRAYALVRVPLVIGFVWVCILTSLAVGRYKIRTGRECGSPSLEADGYHSVMDMYSSVAVLVGLVGGLVGFNLDSLASLVVALLVFKIGLEVMIGAIQGLGKSEVFAFETTAFLRSTAFGAKVADAVENVRTRFPRGPHTFLYGAAQAVWGRRRAVLSIVVLLAVAGYAASGFYRVQPDEVGVVLRFGRLVETHALPGLHYRLPRPMSRLYRLKTNTVRQLEIGFRTVAQRGQVEEPFAYLWESRHRTGIYEKVEPEAIMLTGDKNEVDMNLTVQYQVAQAPESAAAFLFNQKDPEQIVRAATESCTRAVVGIMQLEEVLTTARQTIQDHIQADLQTLLDAYGSGVKVTRVRLQEVHPPLAVVSAFRQVATARENKATMVNQAIAYQKETIPKAHGLAQYILSDAQAHRTEKKLNAQGDALYFKATADAFRSAPEAATFVQYIESIEEVLPSLRKLILSREVGRDSAHNQLGRYFLAGEFLKKALQTLGSPLAEGIPAQQPIPFINEANEEELP